MPLPVPADRIGAEVVTALNGLGVGCAGIRPAGVSLEWRSQVVQEISQRQTQRPRDQPEVEDGDVAFAALDRADEGAMQLAPVSQLLLGQLQLLAAMADATAQLTQEVSL